jgi:hypothetical protein
MVKVNNKVDEAFSGAGFGGRMRCFFSGHSRGVCILLGLAFLAVCVSLYIKTCSNSRLAKMRRDYVNLSDDAGRLKFVKKYKDSVFSGLVLLELGSEALAKHSYALAISRCEMAENALGKNSLAFRAKILRALAIFQAGKHERSFEVFDEIIRDKSIGEYMMAEAMYRYTCCAMADGDTDRVREILQCANNSKISEKWRERIQSAAE